MPLFYSSRTDERTVRLERMRTRVRMRWALDVTGALAVAFGLLSLFLRLATPASAGSPAVWVGVGLLLVLGGASLVAEGRLGRRRILAVRLLAALAAVAPTAALLLELIARRSLAAINFALPATLLIFTAGAGVLVGCLSRRRIRICSRLAGMLGVLAFAQATVLCLALFTLSAAPGVVSPLHLPELIGFLALGTGLVAQGVALWVRHIGPPVRWLPAAVFLFLCAFVGGLWHAVSSIEEGEVIAGPLSPFAAVVAVVGVVLAGLVALALYLAQESLSHLLEEATELRRSERRYRELFEERAAAALEESEARYRDLFENMAEGVFQATLDGQVTLVNPAMADLMGYDSEEELIGVNVLDLYVDPADRAPNIERLQRHGEVRGAEVRYKRKDGSIIVGKINARLVQDPRLHEEAVIEGTLVDVTEQKRLEQQLLQAQKMEAIGQLAGGVAHDFNNLLTAIGGYAELALSMLSDDAPTRHELAEIRRASDRAAKLTRQLLAFSRQQVLNPEVIDLHTLVGGMESLLRRSLGEHVVLETHLADDLGSVRMDPTQLEQVLLNLALNARDAMPAGGRLVISAENVELEEVRAGEEVASEAPPASPSESSGDAPEGSGYVVLRVCDEGQGMDDETRRRALDPFFTTKPQGEGTGLGLSTVYGIVKQSGGLLDIDSRPGGGTAISIYLPRTPETPGADKEAEESTGRPSGSKRQILLVEDDPQVRHLVEDVLTSYGYEVHPAEGADRALQLCHDGLVPSVVVTDVVMPRLSGPELVERLRELRPDCKVLFMSGYSANQGRFAGSLPGEDNYLSKPFAPAELVGKIEKLLG